MTPDEKMAKGLFLVECLTFFYYEKILNKCKSREHGTHVPTIHFKNYQCFTFSFISLYSFSSEVFFFFFLNWIILKQTQRLFHH